LREINHAIIIQRNLKPISDDGNEYAPHLLAAILEIVEAGKAGKAENPPGAAI